MIEILAQITAYKTAKRQGFCAGIILWDDVVMEAAPVVHFMKKRKFSRDEVRDYCAQRGWRVKVIHELKREAPSPQYYERQKRK